jgi:hypothetical protein
MQIKISVGGNMEKMELSHSASGNVKNCATTWEINSLAVFQKTEQSFSKD